MNGEGSFECKCKGGYVLADDGSTCKGRNILRPL